MTEMLVAPEDHAAGAPADCEIRAWGDERISKIQNGEVGLQGGDRTVARMLDEAAEAFCGATVSCADCGLNKVRFRSDVLRATSR